MLSSLGLFWSDEDGSLTLQPCDEPEFIKEPEVGYYYIQVETDSEYKNIRLDRWGTPVRCPLQKDCAKFETFAEALALIYEFNLVSTFHVHKIRYARATGDYVWDDMVRGYCTLKKNNQGKFVLDVSERK